MCMETQKTSNNQSNIEKKKTGTAEMNPARNHKVMDSIPGLTQWVKDPALL